jgi:endonuclease/exonuclease/phosphatase family metal-dependent hydrolase
MIRVATWNVEWATPETKAGKRIQRIIEQIDADIFVLTEGCKELMPEGFVLDGGTDWGYESEDKRRRKVLLWSRYPLADPFQGEGFQLPEGRFIAATVQHPVGDIRIYGVCIPWKDAHVRTGRKDRTPWKDHSTYLEGLRQLIQQVDSPLVVAGDFNQRIPRVSQPVLVAEQLSRCTDGLQVCTALPLDKPLIDHIAVSNHFSFSNVEIIPDRDEHGKLSDHRGVSAELSLRKELHGNIHI